MSNINIIFLNEKVHIIKKSTEDSNPEASLYTAHMHTDMYMFINN